LRFELLLAAVVVLGPLAGAAQPAPPPQIGEAPSRTEVREALGRVAEDPNLAAERTINMLRWKRREAAEGESWWGALLESVARWLRGLFGWVAESGRLLMWVLGAFGAALLIYYVTRLVRTRGVPNVPKRFVAPTHVRDLDIRPESLPDDVGAAALALWQRGEQRAALALLYRGLLSRLVHGYGVPIRASSTEGECLRLAEQRLPERSARYAAELVALWSAAVYGAREPTFAAVQGVCTEFGAALDRKAAQ
jgi:hypothetical protein